jgi:hypothetical protein
MFSVCVCAFFCVCVQVEALRRTDHPSKESYRLSKIKKKNRSETESFMEVGQGPNWGCSANGIIIITLSVPNKDGKLEVRLANNSNPRTGRLDPDASAGS